MVHATTQVIWMGMREKNAGGLESESPDFSEKRERVPGGIDQRGAPGLEITDEIDEVLARADAVLI
jgi:hypothetical protein